LKYRVRYTNAARDDIKRLYAFLLRRDVNAADRALAFIRKGMKILEEFPFTCRKASADNPFLRELLLPFGATGCVALFEIEDSQHMTILAIRHQRKEDYD
jgi:plasmid stabilization system protein ParE